MINANSLVDSIQVAAGVATAIGVIVAAYQIHRAQEQARTDFEDDLNREYRALAETIPLEAHLGERIDDVQMRSVLPHFYRYFDLSNNQAFLRQKKRVAPSTWKEWADGMRSNMNLPAFIRAWEIVDRKTEDRFREFRRLVRSDFKEDPAKW